MTGTTFGTGNSYPSGAPDVTSGFHRGSCCPVICVSLFHVIVCLFFVFWVLIVPFVWLLVSIFFTYLPQRFIATYIYMTLGARTTVLT